MKLLCPLFCLLALISASTVAGQTFTEFAIPTVPATPYAITSGPDGSLWFTEYSRFANKIGRISVEGTIAEFSIPTDASIPAGITAGPDGNIWFTEGRGNKIGRITHPVSSPSSPCPVPSSG